MYRLSDMKIIIKNEQFTLNGILKSVKQYKLAKKWNYEFHLNVNKDMKEDHVNLGKGSKKGYVYHFQGCGSAGVNYHFFLYLEMTDRQKLMNTLHCLPTVSCK